MTDMDVTTAVAHFDAEQLRTLRGLRGGTLLPRLLALYREQAGLQLDRLQAAALGGDLVAVVAVSHAFKSSSRSVGAKKIGDLCEKLETAARSGMLTDGGTDLSEQIRAAYEALVPELEGMLAL